MVLVSCWLAEMRNLFRLIDLGMESFSTICIILIVDVLACMFHGRC